jgi:hypothetical protein
LISWSKVFLQVRLVLITATKNAIKLRHAMMLIPRALKFFASAEARGRSA